MAPRAELAAVGDSGGALSSRDGAADQGGRAGGGCGAGHPVPHRGCGRCARPGAAGQWPARLAGAASAAIRQPHGSGPLGSGDRRVLVLLKPRPAARTGGRGGGSRQAQCRLDRGAGPGVSGRAAGPQGLARGGVDGCRCCFGGLGLAKCPTTIWLRGRAKQVDRSGGVQLNPAPSPGGGPCRRSSPGSGW